MDFGDLLPNLSSLLASSTAAAADLITYFSPGREFIVSAMLGLAALLLPILIVFLIVRHFSHRGQ